MARAYSVYANSVTARWQDSQGQVLDPASLRFLLGESLTLTVYIRDNSNAAVDLTGNTTGWNLALKNPSDLDGTTLLASKAGTVTTAASGIVTFAFTGNDLNSTALATYLADPLGAPGYGKPVAVEVYTLPASDKTVYASGAGVAARSAYRTGDPVALNQVTIQPAFGTGADGALAYTAAGGWTLAGATMTTSSGNWTVSGASLTIHRTLQCTTGSIEAGGTIQAGADNTAQWPELYFTGTLTNAGTIRANLVGLNTSGAVMATPGAARTTTGTGNAPSAQSNSVLTPSPAGGSGAGGGTASAVGGSRHAAYTNVLYYAPRVAGGTITAGATGAGANGDDRAISSSAYSTDPNSFPLLPGGPGSGGGGGGATLNAGTATSGAGGAGGRGGGVLRIRAYGITNSGTIHADGEAGSNGAAATTTGNAVAGGGGAGSGGGGGLVLIWYGAGGYANTGTVRAAAGAAGTGGTGSDSGSPSATYNGGNGGASVAGWVATKQVAA